MKQLSLLLLALLFGMSSIAQVQTVAGNVYDEASKAPLPGVVVVLLNSNPVKGAATDENGRFRIDSVPIGRHSLKISYMSYETRMVNDIVVTAGKEINLNIGLQESIHKLDSVIVVYNRGRDKNHTLNDMAMVSARSFNTDEANRYAGALADPSRMAANFAGVIAGNDSRNDIVVRGNSPNGMLWNIEGLSTPNPNHFGALNSTGGPVSMLNTNNIDKSDFLTGAFPSQYGNALAGVFDIRLRNGNIDKPEYVAQIGFNGFEFGAEGPIGKKTSYLINYRYSTLGVFKQLGINLGTGTSVPIYQDANYKVVSNISKKSKLTLFGIVGASKVSFLGSDVDTTKPDLYSGGDPFKNLYTDYTTAITGLSYDYQISDKSSTKLVAGYSSTYEDYHSDSVSNIDASVFGTQKATFKTGKASLLWTYLHKFNAKNNLQAGVSYEHTQFNLYNKIMSAGQPDQVYVDQNGGMALVQSYVQLKHRFSNKLALVSGLHFQYLDLNNSKAIEPRASIRYALNSRNAFSLGYGIHNQVQSIYSYFVQTQINNATVYTNKNLDFTQSQHIVAAYDLNITQNTRFKMEAYYQQLTNVPVTTFSSSYSAINEGVSFAPPDQAFLTNKGTGYNYGAELTLEHFLNKGFYFLVTSSLINSKYKGSDGIERNTAYNTGYVFNALAGKEFKVGKKGSILVVNIKASTIGGKYLTPVNLIASQYAGKEVDDDSKAYSEQQIPYFRTDFKITYRKEFKRSTMEWSLDLENITNYKNIFNQTYDPRTNRIVNNYQQGFFPVPLFRWTF